MHLQRLGLAMLLSSICTLLIFSGDSFARFQDSLGLYGGVFGPAEESTDGIYGSGLMFGIRHELAVTSHSGLAVSAGVLQKNGNPYNDDTFVARDSTSRLTIVPVELSYIIALISNQPDVSSRIRSLYVGVGANHIWARERTPGSPLAKGNAFGSHVLAGGNLSLSRNLSLGLEIKYLRNRPLME